MRRFRSPQREISVPADYLLLLLLLFIFLFGDMMSWGNSWSARGFILTKQDFGKYFSGLRTSRSPTRGRSSMGFIITSP